MNVYIKSSPEEIIPTKQLIIPRVAFIGEWRATIGATNARRVPRALQHVQQEFVEDRLLAAGARHRAASFAASWKKREE